MLEADEIIDVRLPPRSSWTDQEVSACCVDLARALVSLEHSTAVNLEVDLLLLMRVVERAVAALGQLHEALDAAQARLGEQRVEIEQLRLTRDALQLELMKADGPDRRGVSLLARTGRWVSGSALAIGIASGFAAGAGQQMTVEMLEARTQQAQEACQNITTIIDMPSSDSHDNPRP